MLNGQIALVTGATRGIGNAILLALARSGANVIGTSTTADGADRISSSLRELGLCGRGAVLNVNDAIACDSLLDSVAKEFGPISVLVNNAGVTRDNLSMRMKDEDFESVIETNLSSVFRLSRGVMRGMMKARGGRIINITSVVAHTGNAGQANYCAAKAGLAGLTRALARELGGRSITVNAIAPGFIDTDMTKALDDKHRDFMLSNIPLGRFGTPEDVAGVVQFLASPAAAYITGATIHVNGGMFME